MKYRFEDKLEEELMDNFPLRTMQDLVKIRKPVVERKGRVVKTCDFYKQTGECFGTRCFWLKYGTCKFYDKQNGNNKPNDKVDAKNTKTKYTKKTQKVKETKKAKIKAKSRVKRTRKTVKKRARKVTKRK